MPISSQCPVCRSADTRLFLDGDDSLSDHSVGSSRVKLSPGRILRCNACGLAFRSLRPLPEELSKLYRNADDTVYEAELPNRFRTAQRHRRIVKRYHRDPGRLIDVGSASGAFLRIMADAGWCVIGVEPSASQCERAKRILAGRGEIRHDVLETADVPSDVDLVTLWDVLEHVTEPASFLTRCSELLKRGGVLALNVPRIDSFIAGAMGSHWPLLLAEHLNYFTLKSLKICASAAGLEVIASGSRPVSFSLEYICYRLSQHGMPASDAVAGLLRKFRLQGKSVPIWMGEIYVVCRRR
jgi:SAM-dependent methyltransferase